MIVDCIFIQVDYIAFTGRQATSSLTSEPQASNATMHYLRLKAVLLVFCTLFNHCHANPAAYGACQASCAVVVSACYAANGATFGAVRAAGAPPALLSCNAAFGMCQATCSTVWRAHANGPTALDQLSQRIGGMSLGPPTDEEIALDGLMDGLAKMNIK
jgi:hypothetical protein